MLFLFVFLLFSVVPRYGFAVDMWAAGAVLGEMLAGRPLFPGRSDIDQLYKILQVCEGSKTLEVLRFQTFYDRYDAFKLF